MPSIIFRILNSLCGSIAFQRKVTQPAFLITSVSLVFLGEASILSTLYTNWGCREMIPYMQWFGYIVAFQVWTNWLCVKFVQSKYDPSIHGIEQPKYNKPYPSKSAPLDLRETESEIGIPRSFVTSYLAWSYCIRCDKPRPPRCHHCPICEMCILKRDHHCFLTNVCIGYRNLRHFIIFLFWTVIGSIFCLCHMTPYYVNYILPTVPFLTTSPFRRTYTLSNVLQDFQWIFLTLLFVSLLFFSCWSVYYLQKVTKLLFSGQTSFEMDAGMKVRDRRSLSLKLGSVFGDFWFLNLIIPLHPVFEPKDDPVYWPNLW